LMPQLFRELRHREGFEHHVVRLLGCAADGFSLHRLPASLTMAQTGGLARKEMGKAKPPVQPALFP
jgi:hypothetical protein